MYQRVGEASPVGVGDGDDDGAPRDGVRRDGAGCDGAGPEAKRQCARC